MAFLVPDNATVTVQSYVASQDAGKGTVHTWSNVSTGVTGLFSLVGGKPEGDFASENERSRATFTTEDSSVDAGNLRLKITASDDAMVAAMLNTYWRVESCATHPGLVIRGPRYTCQLSRLETVT